MKDGWFRIGKGDDAVYWQSSSIEKLCIGKTAIEIWNSNKQKYEFYNKEEQDDPGYVYVETRGLDKLEFNKLRAYFEELVGIN